MMLKRTVMTLVPAVMILITACNGPAGQEGPDDPAIVIPEAVDLGLSVKWASHNVGARTPHEYGEYFSWGEATPKDTYYSEDNYSMNTGTWGIEKKYNKDDKKVLLDLEDDAAHVAYGGKWRMPTLEEIDELCTANFLLRKVVREEGVLGIRITSAKTGKSIFLPAAGVKYETLFPSRERELGCYWSSTVMTGAPSQAYMIWTIPSLSRKDMTIYRHYQSRFVGASIRAVQ